jgi:hypothetical protein
MTKHTRVHNLLATPKLDNQAVMLGFVPWGHPALEGLNIIAFYKFPVDSDHEEVVNVYSTEPLEDFMYSAVRDYINHAPFMSHVNTWQNPTPMDTGNTN